MSDQSQDTKIDTTKIINRTGIFGFGFSVNKYMNLLNLVVLAISGIIIKIFFQENYTKLGNRGPATTTIWGFGLTALALFIMIFMSVHLENSNSKDKTGNVDSDDSFVNILQTVVFNDTLPIVLTFIIIMYIIVLNFIYFKRINANKITDSYNTYSFFSSVLIISQIAIIIKYMFQSVYIYHTGLKGTEKVDAERKKNIIKNFAFIIALINLIFVGIKHVLLAFYSTDG